VHLFQKPLFALFPDGNHSLQSAVIPGLTRDLLHHSELFQKCLFSSSTRTRHTTCLLSITPLPLVMLNLFQHLMTVLDYYFNKKHNLDSIFFPNLVQLTKDFEKVHITVSRC
jgi:hypothetical protein